MDMRDVRDGDEGSGQVVSMADARLAQLAAENRRLHQALTDARLEAIERAAAACAAAEVPTESGGIWHLGLTDPSTRQACVEAVRRLLHAERSAAGARSAGPVADMLRMPVR